MIKQISWASYWIATAIGVCLYYMIIGFRFYLPEIKEFFSKKLVFRSNTLIKSKKESDELFPLLNHLTQEIKMFLESAAESGLQQQEVLYGIQLLLRKYPQIKSTSFATIVNSYIIKECSNYCSIHLESSEVKKMWVE